MTSPAGTELGTDQTSTDQAARTWPGRSGPTGWALRQYARTDPDWVRAFVVAHEASLSPLSRRESTKHLS